MNYNLLCFGQQCAQIINLLKKGDKIGAIKVFREETGASLKDAKTYIESLQFHRAAVSE